jgi:GTP-binding protein EngB required for normal cell division
MSERNLQHVVLDIGLKVRDLHLREVVIVEENSLVVCLVVIVLREMFLKQDQLLAEKDALIRVVATQTRVEVIQRVKSPHVMIIVVQNGIDRVQADQAVNHLVNATRVTADQAGNMVLRVVVILRRDCHCCYNVLV